MIIALVLANGILGCFRINAMFPSDDEFKFDEFAVTYNLEQTCFFCATWLFGILYYETAADVERLIFQK